MYEDGIHLNSKTKIISYLSPKLEGENETLICRVIDADVVDKVVYMALEYKHKITGRIEVQATVILTNHQDGFGYKTLCETSYPGYIECPRRILNKLTPTDNINANGWREECRLHLTEKKQKQKAINELKRSFYRGMSIALIKGSQFENIIFDHLTDSKLTFVAKVDDQFYRCPFRLIDTEKMLTQTLQGNVS
jgi:hypothetical protein